MCTDVLISGKLSSHIDCRVNKALVTLCGNALDDNHILVFLSQFIACGNDVLMLDRLREANLSALDSGGTDKRNCTLDRIGEEHTLASGINDKTGAHL